MIEALDIRITGIVQGVGFRPFVYRQAKKHLVNGWVLNAADGVFVHAEAEGKLLDEFVLALANEAPAAAQVEELDLKEVPLQDCSSFEIRFSDEAAVEKTTLVSPDLATCDDCLKELFDPADRRFRYPFINCTNCGPRFTIIERLPYDRKHTSMAGFAMCPSCASEYENPLDRRFHAQPDACFECGPALSWRVSPCESHAAPKGADERREVLWAADREESDALLAAAANLLADGGIVAVKGLGGFHLACDANNAEAVALLRSRKRREGKPFAVMVRTVEDARAVCEVNEAEEQLLSGAQRPIVLLKKRPDAAFALGLADGLSELGVMLPYTPLQHLLLADFAERDAVKRANPPMLVMTSGNLHDEPIVTDDEEAYEKLAGVADAFLGHNRPILARYDDSVVRVVSAGSAGFATQVVRRARGLAPVPIKVPSACRPASASSPAAADDSAQRKDCPPVIFAAGPEQKNTFCLMREGEAFVSQHIGDMENAETYDAWLEAKRCYEALFEAQPTQLACDLHPEYLSTKWAREQEGRGLPLAQVQHHHAHIASVIGEHGLEGVVCGIAFDGTGYGMDGAIWGGEVLLANARDFERFANFAYVPMPGGAAAVKNPLRMAYGVLWAYDLLEHPAAAQLLDELGPQANLCDCMIEQGINTPMTSSVGRLFDAAAAILGVCTQPKYEGEGAILLEAEASRADQPAEAGDFRYAIAFTKNTAAPNSTAQDTSVVLMDAAAVFKALLDDFAEGVPVPVIAARFHQAFADAVVLAAQLANAMYGITTVALSGGVFMNRRLLERVLPALEEAGFTAAINRDLPPNDACISFGQAVVACAQNGSD